MLRYLNGNLNKKSAPDENYGRELQELFCIGKDDRFRIYRRRCKSSSQNRHPGGLYHAKKDANNANYAILPETKVL